MWKAKKRCSTRSCGRQCCRGWLARRGAPAQDSADNSTLTFIRDALLAESRIVSLETALAARKVRDVRVELGGIVRELFAKTSRRWLALKLLERSALDWPELAALWFGEHRLRILQQLTRYFEHRMGSGRLRAAPHPAAPARLCWR
jgi:hypothetical protein